jgi:hypothetical protein
MFAALFIPAASAQTAQITGLVRDPSASGVAGAL